MSEEKARRDAQALASALGIAFHVVRGADGRFSAVQLPTTESEIIATIRPPAEERSLDDGRGFGEMPPQG
jgi:hypothetical protein